MTTTGKFNTTDNTTAALSRSRPQSPQPPPEHRTNTTTTTTTNNNNNNNWRTRFSRFATGGASSNDAPHAPLRRSSNTNPSDSQGALPWVPFDSISSWGTSVSTLTKDSFSTLGSSGGGSSWAVTSWAKLSGRFSEGSTNSRRMVFAGLGLNNNSHQQGMDDDHTKDLEFSSEDRFQADDHHDGKLHRPVRKMSCDDEWTAEDTDQTEDCSTSERAVDDDDETAQKPTAEKTAALENTDRPGSP